VAGSGLFVPAKNEETTRLLDEEYDHPAGLLSEAEINRMLSEEYGDKN
jgi:hypothetical protein